MDKAIAGTVRLIGAQEYEELLALAHAATRTTPEMADALSEALERATVVATAELPAGVVRMGSQVEFRDELSGRVQTCVVVHPKDADIGKGRVSVLTPIGTALIGASTGAELEWETRSGAVKRMTVLAVVEPAVKPVAAPPVPSLV